MHSLPIGCMDQRSVFLSLLRWCGFHSSISLRVAHSVSEATDPCRSFHRRRAVLFALFPLPSESCLPSCRTSHREKLASGDSFAPKPRLPSQVRTRVSDCLSGFLALGLTSARQGFDLTVCFTEFPSLARFCFSDCRFGALGIFGLHVCACG